MKLLMFLAPSFEFHPRGAAANRAAGTAVDAAVVTFVHVEAGDGERREALARKAAKNVKWLAGKRGLDRVVLHSFTHLADTREDPHTAAAIIDALGERLANAGYAVTSTPFGESCGWRLEVDPEPIAKVFKSL